MNTNLYNTNTNSNIVFNEDDISSKSEWDGVVDACIKPTRKIFTKWQYKNIIGELIDPTSKMAKPLIKQTRLYKIVVRILDDYCDLSNGGRTPAEINHLKLMKIKIDGKNLNRVSTTRAINFLIHHNILLVHESACPNIHATMYIGGDMMFEHLQAEKLKVSQYDRYVKKTIKHISNLGLNPYELKTCGCCANKLNLYNFEINENHAYPIALPVCRGCNEKYKTTAKQDRPSQYKNAFRLYYLEINNLKIVAFSEYNRNQMENKVLEREVDLLLKN